MFLVRFPVVIHEFLAKNYILCVQNFQNPLNRVRNYLFFEIGLYAYFYTDSKNVNHMTFLVETGSESFWSNTDQDI
jgi:hypothetical protein